MLIRRKGDILDRYFILSLKDISIEKSQYINETILQEVSEYLIKNKMSLSLDNTQFDAVISMFTESSTNGDVLAMYEPISVIFQAIDDESKKLKITQLSQSICLLNFNFAITI